MKVFTVKDLDKASKEVGGIDLKCLPLMITKEVDEAMKKSYLKFVEQELNKLGIKKQE